MVNHLVSNGKNWQILSLFFERFLAREIRHSISGLHVVGKLLVRMKTLLALLDIVHSLEQFRGYSSY